MPTFVEFHETATGEAPSGEAFDAWNALMLAGFSLQKMMVLPKDAPADAIEAYNAAAAEIVDAPDFRERAGDEIGVYDQLVGPEADAALTEALQIDPAVREFLISWLSEDYDVRM